MFKGQWSEDQETTEVLRKASSHGIRGLMADYNGARTRGQKENKPVTSARSGLPYFPLAHPLLLHLESSIIFNCFRKKDLRYLGLGTSLESGKHQWGC